MVNNNFYCSNSIFDLPLDCIEKMTYITLVRHAGPINKTWLTANDLAKSVSCSKRRISTAIKRLENHGLIEGYQRGNRSNAYLIHRPKNATTDAQKDSANPESLPETAALATHDLTGELSGSGFAFSAEDNCAEIQLAFLAKGLVPDEQLINKLLAEHPLEAVKQALADSRITQAVNPLSVITCLLNSIKHSAPGLAAEDTPPQSALEITSPEPEEQTCAELMPETLPERTICYKSRAELNRKLSKKYPDPVVVCE